MRDSATYRGRTKPGNPTVVSEPLVHRKHIRIRDFETVFCIYCNRPFFVSKRVLSFGKNKSVCVCKIMCNFDKFKTCFYHNMAGHFMHFYEHEKLFFECLKSVLEYVKNCFLVSEKSCVLVYAKMCVLLSKILA